MDVALEAPRLCGVARETGVKERSTKGQTALAASKGRLPTRGELIPVAAVCLTAIHGWSVVATLVQLPSWSLYLNAWEMASAFAYGQLVAFVESALLLCLLVILAAALPAFFRPEFVAQSTLLVAAIILWTAFVHPPSSLAPRAYPFLLPIAGALTAVSRPLFRLSPALHRVTVEIAERSTVFLYIYLPIVAISLLIVLARNVL